MSTDPLSEFRGPDGELGIPADALERELDARDAAAERDPEADEALLDDDEANAAVAELAEEVARNLSTKAAERGNELAAHSAAVAELKARDAKAQRQADAEAADRARFTKLLELNGFHAIRTQLLNAVASVEATPIEAIEAAIDYCGRQRATLEVSADPQAREARTVAERELDALRAVLRFRRELKRMVELLVARESITR